MPNLIKRISILSILFFAISPSAQAQEYPTASLDQATIETIHGLRIERYEDLDEKGLQAEYRWALEMARLCLANHDSIRGRKSWHIYPVEFQRHAGRTARYRGFGEQALQDYVTAIEYAYSMADSFPLDEDAGPAAWERSIRRDIADLYFVMGANEPAAAMVNKSIEWNRAHGEDVPDDLCRLALIAQRQGRFAESLALQRRAVQEYQAGVETYLEYHPELAHLDPTKSWEEIVRHPDVRRAIDDPDYRNSAILNCLRGGYCGLARALRLNGQLDEAEQALETAELTPWKIITTWRKNLDLDVDREWAFLVLAQNKPEEALQKAHACLDKYAANLSFGEKVELLDLVSRALEQLGDLQGAFDKLKEAIAIVENRRANLVEDPLKQLYIAGYAPLYRRALGLVIRLQAGAPGAFKETFEWSERVKARAMLDMLNKLDRRMARALAAGDVEAMRTTRDLAGKVASIEQLQTATWFPADTAILEYASPTLAVANRSTKKQPAAKPETTPDPFFAWVITKQQASLHRLPASGREIDKECDNLVNALSRRDTRDDAWVAPARKLYNQVIAPVADELEGIQRLIIIGDGKLRTIPFEVFIARPDGHPKRAVRHHLLIEDFAISYAPSATLLAAISSKPRCKNWTHELWAFASTKFKRKGAPHVEPQPKPGGYRGILRSACTLSLDELPYARREIERVSDCFAKTGIRTWIDSENMKSQLLSASEDGSLGGVRFLHFATHAIFDPGRPYLSGLVLSPPYPVPAAYNAEKTASGEELVDRLLKRKPAFGRRPELLSLSELAGLKLQSELVVLSACQTLGGQAIDGDWLSGLARSPLVAGASGVLCTTWDAQDSMTAAMVSLLYSEILASQTAGGVLDIAGALRTAKTSLLVSHKLGHPSVWSPYIYHGRVTRP